MSADVTFYTHPMSRGQIVRWMLEEIGRLLGWGMQFGAVPARSAFEAYVERLQARPAFQSARAIEATLIAEMQQAG